FNLIVCAHRAMCVAVSSWSLSNSLFHLQCLPFSARVSLELTLIDAMPHFAPLDQNDSSHHMGAMAYFSAISFAIICSPVAQQWGMHQAARQVAHRCFVASGGVTRFTTRLLYCGWQRAHK